VEALEAFGRDASGVVGVRGDEGQKRFAESRQRSGVAPRISIAFL
jgi:hypothetical protein